MTTIDLHRGKMTPQRKAEAERLALLDLHTLICRLGDQIDATKTIRVALFLNRKEQYQMRLVAVTAEGEEWIRKNGPHIDVN
jgi:hypothetical protein